jgi:hypothetical protein
VEKQQKVEKAKESIGVFGRLFTNNATARILDYFISHRFHSFSIDELGKDLGLSNEIVSEGINQLEKRDIVRRDKRVEHANNTFNDILYILYVESMTANAIIRAGIEIANAESISSKES